MRATSTRRLSSCRDPRGIYYLSQTDAGQTIGSSCVDAGSPDTEASIAGRLAGMTTRTDSVTDFGRIDLGAHYGSAPVVRYPLKVTIIDASGNPVAAADAGGTVDPNSGSVRQFEIVKITAQPKDGWRIKRWVGTADDTKKNLSLTFTANAPIDIKIEFEQIPLFRLVTRAVARQPIDGSQETCRIVPEHSRGELYREGQVVDLKAITVGPYIVDRWTGTDNDASWALTNTVTMTSDKEVSVSFTTPRTLEVPGQYPNIAAAIKAARTHGDAIIVKRGVYTTNSLDFNGKAITLASENPDDPACVALTVIDCGNRGRAFIFQKGEGADSVIDGFTIRNGRAVADANTPTDSDEQGAVGKDAFGGAVACFNGSSPTLSNLVVRNCWAQGQLGEDGIAAYPAFPAPAPADPPAEATPQADAGRAQSAARYGSKRSERSRNPRRQRGTRRRWRPRPRRYGRLARQ